MIRWIVDRFEGAFAVCENEQGGRALFCREILPEDVGEGSVLYQTPEGDFLLDEAETAARRARIAKLQNEIFGD